ncbi:MAG TPA: polyprenyl synthetase family protein [Planctomycetota bacterium]|nr:polyprenyl synthetase family protein [Planctomycetota bacterium]
MRIVRARMGVSVGTAFDDFKQSVRRGVEEALTRSLTAYGPTEIRRVAEYVATGGGHRWRAMACVAAGLAFREDALDVCLPGACGAELAHAASLLLDDLPSMDNATVRRGKPCAHLLFPRWAVDMAPAFLVNVGYRIALDNPLASHERRVAAALELAKAACQMFEGQELDVTQAAREGDPETLLRCYRLKTGALYAASSKAGAILCGASEDDAAVFYDCGMGLGLSYQFLDDTADVVGGVEQAGKDAGLDAAKLTAVSLYGLKGAEARAKAFAERALAAVARFGPGAELFACLIRRAHWA